MTRVLLVEDCPQNRKLMRRWLKKNGYEVDEAGDGDEAYEAALANPPDIILMDMVIPKMNGVEATRKIRSQEGLRKIPVIALTGFCTFQEQKEAMLAGCCAVLNKPVNFQMLDDLLEEQLSSND